MADQFEPAVQEYVSLAAATSTVVFEAQNRRRSMFSICNLGTHKATINFGRLAQTDTGVVLGPGAIYYESLDNRFVPYQGTITAISDDGTALAIYARYD